MCASACVSVYPLAPLQKFSDILKQPVSTLWQNAAKCPWDGRLLQQWACLRRELFVIDSGRTEFQSASMNRARRSVRFERKPSQRYSRRPNFESIRHQDKDRKAVSTAVDSKK